MTKIQLLWPGKTKETWLKQGIDHYIKRLSNFYQVNVIETRAAKALGHDFNKAIDKESKEILKALNKFRGHVVALDVEGRMLSSRGLADFLRKKQDNGVGAFCFVIGGAYGLSANIKKRADTILSLSPMTFTHEMSRIIVIEQLYRAASINAGTPYHH